MQEFQCHSGNYTYKSLKRVVSLPFLASWYMFQFVFLYQGIVYFSRSWETALGYGLLKVGLIR